jgi:hypothetical protein
MATHVMPLKSTGSYPVRIHMTPALEDRDRLTVAFRMLLALPHLLLVGAPIAAAMTWSRTNEGGIENSWGAGGGVLGAVAVVCAIICWFAIVFTGKAPEGLLNLNAFYLRWRVRAAAYVVLLRDEYPPFSLE